MSPLKIGNRYLLTINSFDRINGTPDNYRIQFSNTIKGIKNLRLESCAIPMSWPAFDGTTVYFPLSEDGVTITKVYYPLGWPDTTTFASTTAALLTAASPNLYTYTVTYDADTLGFTITSTGNFSFLWKTDYDNNVVANAALNYMYAPTGFNTSSSNPHGIDSDLSMALSQTSTGAANIRFNYLYVQLDPEIPNTGITSESDTIAFIVPIHANYGDRAFYDSFGNYPQQIDIHHRGANLSGIHVNIKLMGNDAIDFRGVNNQFVFSYQLWE